LAAPLSRLSPYGTRLLKVWGCLISLRVGDSAGVVAQGFGDPSASQEAEEADAGVSEGGHILRRTAALNAAGILAKHHVTNPMQLIFNTPMTAPPSQPLRGGSLGARHAGDRVLHFGRLLAATPGGSRQAADLRDTGPREAGRQAGGRF